MTIICICTKKANWLQYPLVSRWVRYQFTTRWEYKIHVYYYLIYLVQEACWRKVSSDGIIPTNLKKKSDYIRQNFIQLSEVKKRRFYGFNLSNGTAQLYIFADSPSLACKGVAYEGM